MCKAFLLSELRKITNSTDEELKKNIKRLLIGLSSYGVIMLLTCGLTAIFTSWNVFSLTGIFAFLLGLEIFIFYTIFSFCAFLICVYYGAYFAAKGWNRQ